MKINLNTSESDIRVEIIPLIDVIFCILTFFILAALQLNRQQGINVDVPSAKTGQAQLSEIMLVSVDFIGQAYVDKRPVTPEQLTQDMKGFLKKTPNGLVVLNAARNASYDNVIQVLDILRSVEGTRVALGTLPGDANSAPGASGQPGVSTPGAPGWELPNRTNGNAPGGQMPPGGLNPLDPSQLSPQLPQIPGQSGANPSPVPGAPGTTPNPDQTSPLDSLTVPTASPPALPPGASPLPQSPTPPPP
jgi:biopolymer transport protein ExbD